MKIAYTILILISGFCTYSQKPKLTLKPSNQYPNYEFEYRIIEKFRSNYPEYYSFESQNNNVLQVITDISKVNKLEGMATNYTGNAKIKFNLKNTELHLDSTWYYSAQVKASDTYGVFTKLTESYLNSSNELEKLHNILLNSFKNGANLNCTEILKKATEDFTNKDLKMSFNKIKNIENSSCKKEVLELKNKISEAYSEEFCGEKLDKIKILAASGIEYKMDIAVEELLKMPTNAKCKNEVISISKSIGEYLLKKPSNAEKSIQLNQVLISGQDLNTIFRN